MVGQHTVVNNLHIAHAKSLDDDVVQTTERLIVPFVTVGAVGYMVWSATSGISSLEVTEPSMISKYETTLVWTAC